MYFVWVQVPSAAPQREYFGTLFCFIEKEISMKHKLFLSVIIKLIQGFIIIAALIFIPAGTICFFNGWLLVTALFVPMTVIGLVLMIKNPELLRKRINSKEKLNSQNLLIKLSALMFVFGFVVAGLDFRFSWSDVPQIVVIAATFIFFVSYILYGMVIRQNPFLSRTIELQKNQIVVETGLYSIVRHPMYSVTLMMFLSMPLILDSVYSFLVFFIYPFIVVRRIKDEEKFLCKELKGYSEYIKKVKYRLIPYIW